MKLAVNYKLRKKSSTVIYNTGEIICCISLYVVKYPHTQVKIFYVSFEPYCSISKMLTADLKCAKKTTLFLFDHAHRILVCSYPKLKNREYRVGSFLTKAKTVQTPSNR